MRQFALQMYVADCETFFAFLMLPHLPLSVAREKSKVQFQVSSPHALPTSSRGGLNLHICVWAIERLGQCQWFCKLLDRVKT